MPKNPYDFEFESNSAEFHSAVSESHLPEPLTLVEKKFKQNCIHLNKNHYEIHKEYFFRKLFFYTDSIQKN